MCWTPYSDRATARCLGMPAKNTDNATYLPDGAPLSEPRSYPYSSTHARSNSFPWLWLIYNRRDWVFSLVVLAMLGASVIPMAIVFLISVSVA